MNNFLNKNNKKSKNLKSNEHSKKIDNLPKGELKPTGIFSQKMQILNKDLTIPKMPSILTAGIKIITIVWQEQLVMPLLNQFLQYL